jgi:hypothetical protein
VSTAEFARQFGLSETALRRVGVRLSERRPLTTSGMLRKARTDIRAADSTMDLSSAPDALIRQAIYGHATIFGANLAVDRTSLDRLRAELARRYPE